MESLFIPFELAVIAKEKGFEEECFGGYTQERLFVYGEEYYYRSIKIDAPLYQQIVNWFDELGIFITISYVAPDTNKFGIRIDCYTKNRNITNYYTHIYATRVEAENKAIEEAFKLT